MNLADTIKQLQAVTNQIAKSVEREERLVKSADRLQKMYKKNEEYTKNINKHLGNLLPPSILNRLNAGAKQIKETLDRTAKIAFLQKKYNESLTDTKNRLKIMADSGRAYQTIMAAANKRDISQAEILGDLYREIQEAKSIGDVEGAARLTSELSKQQKSASAIAKDLFSYYKSYSAADEKLEQITVKHKAITEEIKAAKKETTAQTQAVMARNTLYNELGAILGEIKRRIVDIAVATRLYATMVDFWSVQEDYAEMNSSLSVRLELLRANYEVGIQTGLATKKIALAQRELLTYSTKQSALDPRRVKTLSMMAETLEVQVDEAAKLSLMSDVIGSNFERTADAITVVVERTNLTARAATNLAQTLAAVYRNIGISSTKLPQITTELGVMSSYVKSLGGEEDAIGRLIARFSSLEGVGDAMLYAGVPGILDPKSLDSAEKLRDVILTTAERLETLSAGGNALLLEHHAKNLGMDLATARAIMNMAKPGEFDKVVARMKQANELRDKNNALETRYMQSQAALGETFNRLRARVSTAIKIGLVPALDIINKALMLVENGIAKVVGLIEIVKKKRDDLNGAAIALVALYNTAIQFGAVMIGVAMAASTFKLIGAAAGIMKMSLISAVTAMTTFGGSLTSLFAVGGPLFAKISASVAAAGTAITSAGILPVLGAVALSLGSAYAVYKAVQKAREMLKAKETEKESRKNLDYFSSNLRQRYNVEEKVDPIERIKQMNRERWEEDSRIATMAAQSSYLGKYEPTQSSTSITNPVYNQEVAGSTSVNKITNYPVVDVKPLEKGFQLMTGQLKNIENAVNKGSNSQVKVTERMMTEEAHRQRVAMEHEALFAQPALTYR